MAEYCDERARLRLRVARAYLRNCQSDLCLIICACSTMTAACACSGGVTLRCSSFMGDVTFASDGSLTRVDNDMRSQRVTSLRRRALDSLLLLRRVLGDDRRGD